MTVGDGGLLCIEIGFFRLNLTTTHLDLSNESFAIYSCIGPSSLDLQLLIWIYLMSLSVSDGFTSDRSVLLVCQVYSI